jgi:hypothetical protein
MDHELKKTPVDILRPDWLGDDISVQIARDYGSEVVQEMLRSGKIIYNEY